MTTSTDNNTNTLPKTFKAMQASAPGQPFERREMEMRMPERGEVLVKVLGHLALQYASRMGFHTIALSSSDAKRDLALSLGAKQYIVRDQAATLAHLGGAKVIICTAPSPEIIRSLVDGLAPDGTLLLVALSEDVTLSATTLVNKRLSVRGWPNGTAKDNEDTLAFSQMQDIKCHIEKFDLLDVEEAYQRMMTGKARFRSVIVPGLKA